MAITGGDRIDPDHELGIINCSQRGVKGFNNETLTPHRYLQLNDNALNGSFPNCIKQLQYLEVLNLGNNNFGGSIPTFIGSLDHLQILSLRSNTFNGSIPEEINYLQKLHILDFSRNNFSGPIPRNIGNLERLKSRPNDTFALGTDYAIFDLQLQMVIKGIMTHFERLYNYNSGIDLSYNILEGNIPEGMGLLKGLVMLSLSHNRFSGKIPASVGYMTDLESLDLSFNRLSGEIPQSLTSMDFLTYLNLSYNSLSGRIPRGLHFETLSVDGSAYIGNPLLCGVPTKNCCKGDPCSSTEDPTSIPKDDEDDQEDAREKWLFYGVVASGFIVGFWGLFFVLLLRKEKWWFGYWRVVDAIAARIVGCIRKK
ncbi:Leucine-rich repeat [Macleaya cordata]|uniref:Leucine-rich repeat n=1 Tax=Macleaya cordata TaxID=56857 RepID=A0A200QUW2_MACCD|nr:Leucine-rich repeat [Macleaya cordata]